MKKLELDSVPEMQPHPLFLDLPEHLKDENEFEKIVRELHKVVYSDHTHKTVKGYVKCKSCKKKFDKRSEMIKEYGFTSLEQYLEWKKIMAIIFNKASFELK